MAKKKKTQLKPVPRPFATASVPKKVVPAETTEGDVSANVTDDGGTLPNLETSPEVTEEPVSDEVKALRAEEVALQAIVEKLQEKTEKEINRAIKSVEYDRRFAKSMPNLSMDLILRKRILKLVLEEELANISSEPVLLNEPVDKVLARTGITFGVLLRMGFSEDRVLECLKAIPSFELDDAFDWLFLHCDEGELDFEKPELQEDNSRIQIPQTPRTPKAFQIGHSSSNNGDTRILIATPATPTTPSPQNIRESTMSATGTIGSSEFASELKTRVMDAYLRQTDFDAMSIGTGSDMLDMDPNTEFAQTKLRVFMRSRQPHSIENGALNATDEARLTQIRQHYFFKEKDANAEFHVIKKAALVMENDARLRDPIVVNGSLPSTPPPEKKGRKERPMSLLTPSHTMPQTSPSKPPNEISDNDATTSTSDQNSESMFGTMLDGMPATETANGSKKVIYIRNMTLPKHWAGRTPKSLLKDHVEKADKYAAISHFTIAGSVNAVRCGVNIRWGSGRFQEWLMEDDGCHDERQAEQFISTVCLHALTFATSPGFASGTSNGAVQTHFRVLPPVFRDLWDELETKRKEAEDAINRSVWRKLKDIVEPKIDFSAKPKKIVKAPIVQYDGALLQDKYRENVYNEQLTSAFRERQMTAAYQEMFVRRMELPIAPYRNDIVRTLDRSQVMVLSGETGCGKSTQVPAFILEEQLSRGQHCKIFCTEPRRISAISLAQRVSLELGDAPGTVGTTSSMVGYSIRLESNTSRTTRLAYVTNGIALRMLESGSGSNGGGAAFDDVTHIIIDEVHERSIESDFLLIVLKSLLSQRPDLKVVLMSATLDAEKISDYFGGCPIMQVPGRTFPVDVRYLEDALELTQWSIKEGHQYAKRANDRRRLGKQVTEWSEDSPGQDDDDGHSDSSAPAKLEPRYSQSTIDTVNLLDERNIPYELIIRLMERICYEDEQYIPFSAAILVFMPGMNEIRRLHEMIMEHKFFGNDDIFEVHPLHSTISTENQGAVFDLPPTGVRKIVIATNIAETGITIPDITCVIDSGKHREMRFDEKRQISRLVETYIARSNAAQRRGRAGRVQAGLCFHLFTKSRHDNLLAEHPLPEMLRLSLSDLALRTKILKAKLGDSIEDVLSKALDPPSQINVQRAVSALVEVKALTQTEEITPMGRLLSKLPTDVHLGKFLLTAAVFGCLDPALTIAATLNSKSPFLTPFGHEEEAQRAKNAFKIEGSDFLTIHSAFSSWRRACSSSGNVRTYCRKNFLSHQNLQQIEELRQQFMGYLVDSAFIRVDKSFEREISRTRFGRGARVRFVNVPTGFDYNSNNDHVINAALAAGLYPKVLVIDSASGQLRTFGNNQPTSFHPSSINFGYRAKDFGVNHLCYFTLMHSKKLYAWESGPIDDLAMFLLCGDVDFKLSSNSAFLDRKVKFHLAPKTNVALKLLRERLASVLATQMRGKQLSSEQRKWSDIALLVLGKEAVKEDEETDEIVLAAPPSVDLVF